jgi:hypothetical protein
VFEGQVPPFFYPDKHFGPDLLLLMWIREYSKFLSVLSQAKFPPEYQIDEALRTLVPELLYHMNRGKDSACPTNCNEEPALRQEGEG